MPRKSAREKIGEGLVADRDRRTICHQKADAAQRGQRRQRDDEGGQAHADDTEGMEGADRHADQKRNAHGRPERHAVLQQPGNRDTGEADHGADGQIDTGSNDDEGLPDRKDRRHGALPQQVADIIGGPETRRGEGREVARGTAGARAGSGRTGCSCPSSAPGAVSVVVSTLMIFLHAFSYPVFS